jgi:putative transposase
VTKLTDARIEWLVRQAQGRARPPESIGQLAARWGVTPRWLRKLLQRWRRSGVVPRLNPRRRPPAPPLSEEQRRLLTEEYRRSPRGATKLYKALARRGIHIPKMQIYRFGKAQKWVVPNPRKQRSRRWVRYERTHSGSLLHGDFHRTSLERPHCILWEDDASRMVLAGGEFAQETTREAIATLTAALRQAEAWNLEVKEVNTDRGTQFYASLSAMGERSKHAFPEFLRSHGIRHVLSRVNHPQTNGKLERLWREYDRHRWRYERLEAFIDWYNDQIHDSLWVELYETPNEAWQRKMPMESQLGLFLHRLERGGAVA